MLDMKTLFTFVFLSAFSFEEIISEKKTFYGAPQFVVEYFFAKGVTSAISTLCLDKGSSVDLSKSFSRRGIGYLQLDLSDRFNETKIIDLLVESSFSKPGIIVDIFCPGSMDFLQLASDNNLFIFSHCPTFWLILTHTYLPVNVLRGLVDDHVPAAIDLFAFLTEPYENRTKEKHLFRINRRVNSNFIKHYRRPHRRKTENAHLKSSHMEAIFKMKILADNKITVAVPTSNGNEFPYDLYGIRKVTEGSVPEIRKIGRVVLDGSGERVELDQDHPIRDFRGNWLKAGSAAFYPERFTVVDDLSTREIDLWPKITYEHIKALSEDLNLRVIVRFFSDYGWFANKSFSHLMGSFQKQKSDFSATGLLMITERYKVVHFLMCPFRMEVGILFREPSLSSVSNIFLLPFSRSVWIGIGLVIVSAVIVMRVRAVICRSLPIPDSDFLEIPEILGHVLGAICQQGSPSTPASIPDRIAVITIFLSFLALFSSYSASIVALLQSSSSAILSVGDITASTMRVGIQSRFPYFNVLINVDIFTQEPSHPVLRQYYERKILNSHEKLYFTQRDGVEKIRNGMFAFQVELNAGYKFMSQTYTEREKCGVKEIDLIPKPFICMAVRKNSSYKEIFAERFMRQREIGLFDRSWKRWVDQKPKCRVERIDFISVGLTEFHHVFWIFIYGATASLAVVTLELMCRNLHSKKNLSSLNCLNEFVCRVRERAKPFV